MYDKYNLCYNVCHKKHTIVINKYSIKAIEKSRTFSEFVHIIRLMNRGYSNCTVGIGERVERRELLALGYNLEEGQNYNFMLIENTILPNIFTILTHFP